MVQTAHNQVPPEVPVKLLEMPSNRGGWTWLEVPKITKPLGLVDDGVVGWTGLHVYYIQQKPKKKRKSKATQRREEDTLSVDEPYELEEKKSTMWRVCHWKGPKRCQQQHKMECHWAQLPTTYQWNRDEEDLIKKKASVWAQPLANAVTPNVHAPQMHQLQNSNAMDVD